MDTDIDIETIDDIKVDAQKNEKKNGKNASKLVSIRVKPNVDNSTKLNLK